ncbi:NGG1p interacting factor 3 [Neocallimastix californiae]|uniref:NGG1p interacting factor 3 n=1 Tax=Neocallimastix californiae TaxID=1754190 RepID=A0A1Y2CIQ4_9FUNG|nr:NGG1p interacting factor 3 [Neocallimastix californiae]|eukprot:ORY46195.1 NGG1p interacting factor 3 [Neocallimastix californiae]
MANPLLTFVLEAMNNIAPLSLADNSWDNVGLLLEAPIPRENANGILLTIDLTLDVVNEAIKNPNIGVIISYHPPIFKSLKRLVLENEKQKDVLLCAAKGISIYSPHTSLDNCADGVNNWLAQKGQETAGTGRMAILETKTPFLELTEKVKKFLNLDYIRYAIAKSHKNGEPVSKVAICVGSGSSVLLPVKDADVYLTGEMSHHDVLYALSNNKSVILCEHTNSERGYLEHVLKPKLVNEIAKKSCNYEVYVSKEDVDPYHCLH